MPSCPGLQDSQPDLNHGAVRLIGWRWYNVQCTVLSLPSATVGCYRMHQSWLQLYMHIGLQANLLPFTVPMLAVSSNRIGTVNGWTRHTPWNCTVSAFFVKCDMYHNVIVIMTANWSSSLSLSLMNCEDHSQVISFMPFLLVQSLSHNLHCLLVCKHQCLLMWRNNLCCFPYKLF